MCLGAFGVGQFAKTLFFRYWYAWYRRWIWNWSNERFTHSNGEVRARHDTGLDNWLSRRSERWVLWHWKCFDCASGQFKKPCYFKEALAEHDRAKDGAVEGKREHLHWVNQLGCYLGRWIRCVWCLIRNWWGILSDFSYGNWRKRNLHRRFR